MAERTSGKLRRARCPLAGVPHRCPGVVATLLVTLSLCLFLPAHAVELNNWRAPFLKAAAEMELLSSSPSGMFWDDLPVTDALGSDLMPAGKDSVNHWRLEPAFLSGGTTVLRSHGHGGFFNTIGASNDIRYRNLFIRQTLAAGSVYKNDSLFPAHRDRITAGRIEEAYLQANWSHGFLRFGRLLRNWGPFVDRSLLLSSNPYSYDALEWQVHSSVFEFRHLVAAFARNPEDHFHTTDNLTGRYVSIHSLNLMLGKWVTLGIVEAMVFRRENGLPDLQYLNPFSAYTVTNTNREGRGNLMLGLQWNIHPGFENLSFRGQIALDDFQVDNRVETDKEPNHWGMDAGVYWRDPFHLPYRHLIKAGYRRCSEWLYTVSDEGMLNGDGYTYLAKGLGFPKADGDHFWLGASVIGKKAWVATGTFSYAREGERQVTDRWRDSEPDNIRGLPFDYQLTAFPSGVVTRSISLSLNGSACVTRNIDVSLGIVNQWVKNRYHQESSGFNYLPIFTAAAGVHLPDLYLSLPR